MAAFPTTYHLCINGLTEAIHNHSIVHLGDIARVHRPSENYARPIQGYSPAAA
jgi:hypothetical protein